MKYIFYKILYSAYEKINRWEGWRGPVKIQSQTFFPPSLDRLIALYLGLFHPGSHSFKPWLQSKCAKGDIVLDIGANQGLFAMAASEFVGPNGSIHSFEPDPELFDCLKKNIKINKKDNIFLYNIALGHYRENLFFKKNPFNQGDNRLLRHKEDSCQASFRVPVIPLDGLDGIHSFDLVKIDVQGWEPAVFKGMEGKLALNPKAKILFEFWPYGMKLAGYKPEELLFFLIEKGYLLCKQPEGNFISHDQVPDFVKSLDGKKYTDISAFRA